MVVIGGIDLFIVITCLCIISFLLGAIWANHKHINKEIENLEEQILSYQIKQIVLEELKKRGI